MLRLTSIIATAGLFACGASEAPVRPAEQTTAESPAGYEAAQYEIRVDDTRMGEAKLWSLGATELQTDQGERTVVRFGVELTNRTNQPWSLDVSQLALDVVTKHQVRMENITPRSVRGQTVVPPGRVRRATLYFWLSSELSPTDLGGMRLRWAILQNGERYTQHTPFVHDYPGRYRGTLHLYYSPFYDPYLYYYPRYRVRVYRHAYRGHRQYRARW